MWRSKTVWFRVIWSASLAAGAMAQISPRPMIAAETSFRITGTVVHGLTGQPMPHVQMSIFRNQSPDLIQTVMSDDEGRFSFEIAKAGKYVLVGQAHGFDRQAWDEHAGFSTAVAVGEGKDSENILFRLHPDASISGLITDDADEAVRDAQVMLFHQGSEQGRNAIHWRQEVQTDDQGRYHFAHVPPGTYFVVVSARPWYAGSLSPSVAGDRDDNGELRDVTYPVTYYSGATEAGEATPIMVRSGDRATADLVLTPVPSLRLDVTGLRQAADEMAAVYVTQKVFDEVPVALQGQSYRSENGEFHVSGLPAGQLLLNIQSNGKNPTSWVQPLNLSGNSEVQAKPGGAGFKVSGTVSLNGEPSAGGILNLTNHATGISVSRQISDKGEFQISDSSLKPGTYEVAVFNVRDAVVAGVAANGAKVHGRDIEISGSDPVQLVIVMSKGLGRIDGTAMRGDKPLAGAMIVLVPQDIDNNRSLIRRDQSDSDGTFTLPDILPGDYTVIALQNEWDMEWESAAALKPYLQGGEAVAVGPSGKYEVTVGVQ